MEKSENTQFMKRMLTYQEALTGISKGVFADEILKLPALHGEMGKRDFRIRINMCSVYLLYAQLREKIFVLEEEFHRDAIWTQEENSKVIESIILGIPIQSFFFCENTEGKRTVLDGVHRLNAINTFLKGEYALTGLPYKEDLNDVYFSGLSTKYKKRILETQITCYTLDAQCSTLTKIEIFRRINTCGRTLSRQEIRYAMLSDSARKLLYEMCHCKEFALAVGGRVNDERMGAQELCLEYLFFRYRYSEKISGISYDFFSEFRTDSIMDFFVDKLNDIMKDIKEAEEALIDFKKGMEKCYALFGGNAFVSEESQKQINPVLFISWGIAASRIDTEIEILQSKSEQAAILRKNYHENFMNQQKNDQDTSIINKVNREIETAGSILEALFR